MACLPSTCLLKNCPVSGMLPVCSVRYVPGLYRPIPPTPPLLSMLFKINDLQSNYPTFRCNFLIHNDLSHSIPFKGLMIPRCARDFALRRCSGQAQIVKERTHPAPARRDG